MQHWRQGWSQCFDVFILGLVSDADPSNLKLARWLSKNLPQNSLLIHHVCDLQLESDQMDAGSDSNYDDYDVFFPFGDGDFVTVV